MMEWLVVTTLGGWAALQCFHASGSKGRLGRWNWFGQFGVWAMFTVGNDDESQDFMRDGPVEIQFREGEKKDWTTGFPVQAGSPFWYRIFNPDAYLRDLGVGALEGAADTVKRRPVSFDMFAPLRSAILLVEERYPPRAKQSSRHYRLVRREGDRLTEIWSGEKTS